jgi:excisionase family DNA binding protein
MAPSIVVTNYSIIGYVDTNDPYGMTSRPGDRFSEKMKKDKTQLVRRAFQVKEVAAMLGVSEASIRRLIYRGQLRPSRVLRHLLIPSDQVDDLLK